MPDIVSKKAWTPISEAEHTHRLNMLRESFSRFGVDAIILTPGANMRYISGLAWSETERLVCALITQNDVIFICPKFEDTSLLAGVKIDATDYSYWEEHEDPYAALSRVIAHLNIRAIALDHNCSYGHAARLKSTHDIQISSAQDIMTSLRSCKSKSEISLMSAAKTITNKVHHDIFNWITPGVYASQVKGQIDFLHRRYGADNGSSFCAVQFGEATSHPHGVPGDQILKENDLILIDTGCTVQGYNSDITRTYALNKVSEDIERIWDIEKEAQWAVFEKAELGMSCGTLDDFVREFLQSKGLSEGYKLPGLPHRLGHGIGLDIHEGPYLVRGETAHLAQGMCFSNEPMIVMPGQFGVRLEDHFYVTSTGVSWFTNPQYSLYQPYA